MSWPPSFEQTTVGVALLGAGVALIRERGKPDLVDLISKLLAASAIPTSMYLLASAFNPAWVQKLSDVGLYLAAAGLALLYVSLKELFA